MRVCECECEYIRVVATLSRGPSLRERRRRRVEEESVEWMSYLALRSRSKGRRVCRIVEMKLNIILLVFVLTRNEGVLCKRWVILIGS